MTRYEEVVGFVETNHRNPSKHRIEEHDMLNWVKQQQKMFNAEQRIERKQDKMYKQLLETGERYRRIYQYT